MVPRPGARGRPPTPGRALSSHRPLLAALVVVLLSATIVPSVAAAVDAAAPTTDAPPATRALPPAARTTDTPTDLEVVEDRPAFARGSDGSGRSHGSAVDLEPFTTIGLDLGPSGQDRGAEVRVHTHTGWGPWFALEHHEEHSPDPGAEASGRVTTDPAWVGLANAYEVRLPADLDPATVSVLLVVDTGEPLPPPAGPPAPEPSSRTPNTAQPPIRLRSSWNPQPYRGVPEVAEIGLRQAIVHHSVTVNWYAPSQVPGILRGIQAFHQDGNGWYDIAYNFAVDRFGAIWEARQGGVTEAIIGGHTKGFNTGSTGVVVLGDYTTTVPTSAMINAVGDLLGWKLHQHGIDPASTGQVTSYGSDEYPEGTVVTRPRVSGHRDFSATGCPGQQVYNRLGTIRARAAAIYRGQLAQQPSTGIQPIVGDFQGDGEDDVLLYRPGTSPDVLLRGDRTVPLPRVRPTINGTYRTTVGDFDGDGADDILFDGHGSNGDSIWYGSLTGGFTSTKVRISGSPDLGVGDFDDDGRDDLLLYGPGPAAPDAVWYGLPRLAVPQTEPTPPPPPLFDVVPHNINGFYEPLLGDYDRDGRTDVLWYGAGSGADALWWGSSSRAFGTGAVDIKGVYQPLVGDFDGDRRDDVLWYGSGGAPDALWWGGAGRRFSSASISIKGRYLPFVGEFTGNGVDDIIWYGPGTTPDSFWWGHPRRSFTTLPASMNGIHTPVVGEVTGNRIDDVLWLTAGRSTGSLWMGRPTGVFARVTQPLT